MSVSMLMQESKNKGDQLLNEKLQPDYFGVEKVQTYIGSMNPENATEDIYAKIQLFEGSNTTLQFVGDHYYEKGSKRREVVGKIKAGVAIYFDKPIFEHKPREMIRFGSNEYAVLNPLDKDTYSMTIGKERVYSVLGIGSEIKHKGELSARLVDITTDSKAVLEIIKDDDVVGQIHMAEGQTYTYVNTNTGEELIIHAYKNTPGFDTGSKYSEIAIVDDVYKLTNNQILDQEANDINRYTKVFFGHDFDINHISSRWQGVEQANMIFLYPEDAFNNKIMGKGDEIDMPTILSTSLVYEGLNDTLKHKTIIENAGRVNLYMGDGQSMEKVLMGFSIEDASIEVRTEGGRFDVNNVYIDPETKKIYARLDESKYHEFENMNIKANPDEPNTGIMEVRFEDYDKKIHPSIRDVEMVMTISEVSRPELENSVSLARGEIIIPIIAKNGEYRFKTSDISTGYSYYKDIGAESPVAYVPLLITNRGTEITSVDTTTMTINITEVIGTGRWRFKNNYKEEDPTKVQEKQMNEQVNILLYPNPTDGILNLDIILPETSETTVEIFDEAGNRVMYPIQEQKHMAGAQEMRFDLSDLQSGTYFLKVSQRGWSEVSGFSLVK
jgi:hypothetical protein